MRNRTLIALAAIALIAAGEAGAAEKVRIGKAVPHVFSFVPVEIGVEKGFYQKNGVEIENVGFQGGARLHQGLASDSIDIGLGSGPELQLVSKGDYAIGVAGMANAPLTMAYRVRDDSPIKTLNDLKGKKVGISTQGSLTHWLTVELARLKGWGPDGITPVALGGAAAAQQAALKTGAVDAVIESAAIAFQLEKSKEARFLAPADYVTDFHTHIIWSTTKFAREKPDALRGFLKGWFETIAFMKANKAETVRIARTVTNLDEEVENREYDLAMPNFFSDDGKFNPQAIKVLERSFVELGLLDKAPDSYKFLTERFLPSSAKSM